MCPFLVVFLCGGAEKETLQPANMQHTMPGQAWLARRKLLIRTWQEPRAGAAQGQDRQPGWPV